MGKITGWMDRRFFPGYRDHWDDDLFRERVLNYLKPGHTLLDVGAGAGILPQMNFKKLAKKVCGVDPDPRVRRNPFLDEGVVGVGENLPYPDDTFDMVIANNVLEHIAQPEAFLAEIFRVLRGGGMVSGQNPEQMPLRCYVSQDYSSLGSRNRG